MIGRMAPSNPWIFRQIEQYVGIEAVPCPELSPTYRQPTSASRPWPLRVFFLIKPYDEPTEADRYQMIRTYFQMLLEEEIHGTEGKMKQFASWFTHGVPGGAALRKAIYDAKSGAEILESVEEFFESRLQLPTT